MESSNNAPQGYNAAADADSNKAMGILAYLGFLFLVPLLAAPGSPFAKYHANQGLILFICEMVLGVLSVVFAFIPFIGWLLSLITWLGALGCFVLAILGIVNAVNGKMEPLPLIGGFTLLK